MSYRDWVLRVVRNPLTFRTLVPRNRFDFSHTSRRPVIDHPQADLLSPSSSDSPLARVEDYALVVFSVTNSQSDSFPRNSIEKEIRFPRKIVVSVKDFVLSLDILHFEAESDIDSDPHYRCVLPSRHHCLHHHFHSQLLPTSCSTHSTVSIPLPEQAHPSVGRIVSYCPSRRFLVKMKEL